MRGSRFVRSDVKFVEPLLAPLFYDLVQCEDLLDERDTQFARRTFVRALFAFLEAQIYWFRNSLAHCIAHDNLLQDSVDVTKLALLFDAYGQPDKQGRVRVESTRMPFLNSCAFVLRSTADYAGLDASECFSDNGWNELQQALRVRNRITHPKNAEELDISEEEMFSVRQGYSWVFQSIRWILNALGPRDEEGT